MKRSEMLKELHKYFDINAGNPAPEGVLKLIENFGMVPPRYEKSYDEAGYNFVNQWEPEDE